MDFLFLIIFGIIVGLIIAIIDIRYFGEENKAKRRKNKNKKYCENKSNYTFHEKFSFSKISDELKLSHVFYPDKAYNQRLRNVIKIEEDDFTLYLGDFFYQKDVTKSKFEKGMEIIGKYAGKGRRYYETHDPYKYDKATWPRIVPVPKSIGEDIHNYYYFQKFAIIQPKIRISFPNFMLRTNRLGLEKFKNIVKLSGHPIFNWRYMLSGNQYDIESFFNYSKTSSLDRLIDRSYVYETVNGLFIIKSEASLSDSIERLHKNALAMFGGWLCNEDSGITRKYTPSLLYFATTIRFRFFKVLALLFVAMLIGITYQHRDEIGGTNQPKPINSYNRLYERTMDYRFKLLVTKKEVYIPELMKGYTWKNIKKTRLVDAMVFSYEHINDPDREKFFKPRFEKVKPQNLENYPTELVPRIKERLGIIQNYSARSYDEAMQSGYQCDDMLIVDTAALWLFVSRYYAQNNDLETAFLLPYAAIISAYESENKTANAMSINSRIQHLDAMNISAFHLLYLAVKYAPDYTLLKSIAKDMLAISRKQLPCSSNIKYHKQQFLEAFNREHHYNPDNTSLNKIYEYNLLDKYTKTYVDDYLQFADLPYPQIAEEYFKWSPSVKPEGTEEERDLIENLNNYFCKNIYAKNGDYIRFRKIVEQYLTEFEGIATALLCRAYELQNGSLPESISELEIWSDELLPKDRFSNKPYEINKYSNKILFSVGPDLIANTKNDIRFW